MKKLYLLLLGLCISWTTNVVIAQDVFCVNNEKGMPPSGNVDVYFLTVKDNSQTVYAGIPILGQCQKITRSKTGFEYALTDEEIKEFIKDHGAAYLNIYGFNYFLNVHEKKYYFVIVSREGGWCKKSLWETIPNTEFINIFLKKKGAPDL